MYRLLQLCLLNGKHAQNIRHIWMFRSKAFHACNGNLRTLFSLFIAQSSQTPGTCDQNILYIWVLYSKSSPDLMSEYFVYTWLLQHPDEVQQFLYSAWQRPDPTSVFFDRIIKDYSYLLNKSAEHWKLVVPSDIQDCNGIPYTMFILETAYNVHFLSKHNCNIQIHKVIRSRKALLRNIQMCRIF